MESEYEECAFSVGTHSYRCVEVDGDFVDSMSPKIKLCRDKNTNVHDVAINWPASKTPIYLHSLLNRTRYRAEIL